MHTAMYVCRQRLENNGTIQKSRGDVDCHWKHTFNTGNVLLKHVFSLDGRFDSLLNLCGECVTGKASSLMANEEGELMSVCYRDGKVLLKRKHWHQSIRANSIRLFQKAYNYIVTIPIVPPHPTPPLPPNNVSIHNKTAKKQSSMTIPQNNKHVLSRRNLNCLNNQWFIWHKFPFLLQRMTKVSKSPQSFIRAEKLSAAAIVFSRWFLLMPL